MIKARACMTLAAALMAALCASAAFAGAASAAQPWWHLSLGARPTVIPATAANSRQELKIEEASLLGLSLQAEGAQVACLTTEFVVNEGYAGLVCKGTPEADVVDDAAQLQALLQARYPGVAVSGESGGEGKVGSGEPLLVSRAGRGMPPLKIEPGSSGSGAAKVLSEGGSGRLVLEAVNLGDAPIDGESTPVVISDKLPAGLVADGMAGSTRETYAPEQAEAPGLTCSVASVRCTYTGKIQPYQRLEIVIWVRRTGGGATGGLNEVEVSGGGANPLTGTQPVRFGEGPVPFGVESYETEPEQEGGTPATQAGSHPFQMTTTLRFNESGEFPYQPAQPRNLSLELPAGFVGNVAATPKCTYAAFSTHEAALTNACPADTAVGVASATVVLYHPPEQSFFSQTVPVFNLTPAPGEPARFGFTSGNVPVVLDTHLRAGGDYGVTVDVQNLTENGAALASVVTLWGVPGDPVHDQARGWECLKNEEQPGCGPSLPAETPFLTLPSACASSSALPVSVQAWPTKSLASPLMLEPFHSAYSGPIDGCNREAFEPSLQVDSSANAADTPTELNVHLKVPQQISEVAGGVAEADVRSTKVALPAGLQLNPAAAGGLQGCGEAQVGFARIEGGRPTFDEESQAERYGEEAHRYTCPEASKIGTVKIKTPLLEEELTGAVYQAAQGANPFGSLLALYVIAEAPQFGVRVRLAGEVKVEPGGQIVSTFDDTPQLPFGEFDLKFFGDAKAPLATTGCGTYTTTSSIESWAGGQPVAPFSTFDVNGNCSSLGGFTPRFQAGTTNNDGGAFSPLSMTMSRNDGEQALSTVSITMPPGLAGMISHVTPCLAAVANGEAWNCPAAAKIGHVRVSAGIGNEPIVLPEAGKPEDPVYLTQGYGGAPFGLAIVVPAEAGPFNLDEGGHPVVVRAKIAIDPHTAQVTIASDPMPTELQNIKLQVRKIEVIADRSQFMFNPTDCAEQHITGTIGSAEGKSESVSSRFEAANCATLKFKPSFKVSTSGKTSRANGASLHVKLAYPKAPFGTQANIRSVHVELPKALPSRLSTLNHACLDSVFNQNPASCPSQSRVGFAKAVTPVLPVPLEGPAYFVSHGGQRFPELIVVLQGYGVTVDLQGETFISKAGITSSTFKSVPDVPVGSFELTLPQGPFSALAANRDLCTTGLTMPTKFTGQNGAVLEQKTAIEVQGCPYALRIVGRRVHKRTLTLKVSVPVAGKLVGSGKGVSKASKSAKGRQTLTLTLKERRGGKLRTKISLRFTPKGGGGKQRGKKTKILHKSLTVTFR
jgi:hypothetical protein